MKDLTKGNVLKTLISFSLPIIGGNLFQLLYNFSDSLIVGNILGVNELAGVGATGSLNFFVVGFATGVCTGFSIIVARFFGAKDEEALRKSIAHSLVLAVLIGLVLSVGSVLMLDQILSWMNTPKDIYRHSYNYIGIIFGGIVITMMYNVLAGHLRSVGDSKSPLYVLIISSIVNIVLDIVCMGVLPWGVAGAAIATLFSQLLSVVLCLIIIFRKYKNLIPAKEHYVFDKSLTKELLAQGISMGIMGSFIAVGNILVQSALNALGTVYVAANTAANKISQLFMQPLGTFGTAMATFASQNLGAGKIDRVKAGLRCATIMSTVWSAFCMLCSFVIGTFLIGLLVSGTPEEVTKVLEEGSLYLRAHLSFFFFLGPIFIYRNTMQGIGNKSMPLVSSLLELGLKIITALWVAPSLGYIGIAFCEPVAWVVCGIFLMVFFYRDPRVKALKMEKA